MTLLPRALMLALSLVVFGHLAGCEAPGEDHRSSMSAWEDNYAAGRVHPPAGN